jgi:uncharacterized membrane protein
LGGRVGPNVFDALAAAVAIIMIPFMALAFMSVKWWYGFVPLGIIVISVLTLIVLYLRRAIKEIEREENIL